jgi:site-specific DNA recombinase
METKQVKGAALYIRVSTDEQAEEGLSLGIQEKQCRDYCARNGLPLSENAIFIDPGESARSAKRPEFQRMLTFCRTHRGSIGFVVVSQLSRFARNNKDQANAICELRSYGIDVRSVSEPNVDDTPAGRLAANLLGAFNQYFSDDLSDRMQKRMRTSVEEGRFPWPAPIGYRNVKMRNGANIVPDPERAPLIREAFELSATGLYKKAEVLRIVTEKGLRTTHKNKCLSPQTFVELLKKPVYCGWVCPPSLPGLRVKGLHEPIVSEDLFNRVQDLLCGRKQLVAGRRRHNPKLPLKWFVKCAHCGTPLTGAFCTGKNKSKKYARYWCRNGNCGAVKLSKAALEQQFLALLRRLQPEPTAVASFPRVAAKVWAEKQGDIEANAKRFAARLNDAQRLKSELLRARLRHELSQADFERANAEFDDDIAAAEGQLALLETGKATLNDFIAFAELLLADIAGTWEKASGDQRQRVQNLLFLDGLQYHQESGFLNTSKPSLFRVLEEISTEKGILASPTGFEPVLSP